MPLSHEGFEKKFREWINKLSPAKDRPSLSSDETALIHSTLGYPGRMLSGSKQAAKTNGKEHFTVFNANLVVEGYGKVWFGDIDITRDEDALKTLARSVDKTVYVLREHDARFTYENNPQLQKAVYTTDGKVGDIGTSCTRYYGRAIDGKIYARKLFND